MLTFGMVTVPLGRDISVLLDWVGPGRGGGLDGKGVGVVGAPVLRGGANGLTEEVVGLIEAVKGMELKGSTVLGDGEVGRVAGGGDVW